MFSINFQHFPPPCPSFSFSLSRTLDIIIPESGNILLNFRIHDTYAFDIRQGTICTEDLHNIIGIKSRRLYQLPRYVPTFLFEFLIPDLSHLIPFRFLYKINKKKRSSYAKRKSDFDLIRLNCIGQRQYDIR